MAKKKRKSSKAARRDNKDISKLTSQEELQKLIEVKLSEAGCPGMIPYWGDWNKHGVDYVIGIDPKVYHAPSVEAFLESIKERACIWLECTWSSFPKRTKYDQINMANTMGHTLCTTPTRFTAEERDTRGVRKTNQNDARMIREVALRLPVKKAKVPTPKDLVFYQEQRELNLLLVTMRETVIPVKIPHKRGNKTRYIYPSWKELWGELVIRKLEKTMPYSSLEPEIQSALGDGECYHNQLASFLSVTSLGSRPGGRPKYERLLGNNVHASPQIMRSEYYHWGLGAGDRRERISDSLFRKAVRRMRVPLQNIGLALPTQGDIDNKATYFGRQLKSLAMAVEEKQQKHNKMLEKTRKARKAAEQTSIQGIPNPSLS